MANVERADILFMEIPKTLPNSDVARLFPPEMAEELHVVPLAVEDGALTVAIASTRDRAGADTLAEMTGYEVFAVLSPPDQWGAAMQRFRALCSDQSPGKAAEEEM